MTTPNNDELRRKVRRALTNWRSHDLQNESPYYPLDDIMQLIATHDQQLLEAILEGRSEYYSPALRVDAVSVEHIKSVFGKEGES